MGYPYATRKVEFWQHFYMKVPLHHTFVTFVAEMDSAENNSNAKFDLSGYFHDVRIIRALILGEPERGQNQYQVLCFISRLNQHEIIPTESMARLRQKNPHLVHMAEERRGVEHLHMDMVVNVSRTGHLNTLIHNLCKEAHEGFYTRTADTKHWLDEGIEAIEFEPLPQTADAAGLQRCPSTLDMWQPCICSYFLRLEWLPCMLKYCRSLLAVAGRANPYKCGIRSCSKGYRFDYYVPHRQLCPWDEET
ncbi:out at first protein homolog isoform X2 [Coregonus clupeaformis]|uniref:out at first protein homolog isoform X2 n=1 Tax=Coregonus clupeaformis TaxID=59861 RepID=UPI001E1C6619|nr:out at first protein homolog isoform X2 [Coregonus clupeaformis]